MKKPKRINQWTYGEFWDRPNDLNIREFKIEPIDFYAISLIPESKNGLCLDIGCGSGLLTEKIKERGYNVISCDFDERAIKLCKEKGTEAIQVNSETDRIPFDDNHFDLISCFEVIEHIKSPQNMLNEIHRTLKQDGIFVISTPNISWWYLRIKHLLGIWDFHDMDHIRFYNPNLLKRCLNDFGFKVIQVKSIFVCPRICKFQQLFLHNFSCDFAFRCIKI